MKVACRLGTEVPALPLRLRHAIPPRWALAALAVTCTAASPLWAQSTSSATAAPRVTVTGAPLEGGERTAEIGLLGKTELINAPFSMTTYGSRAVQNEMARTVTDLMINDASIRVPAAADGVYDNFTIRGFQSTSASHSLGGLYGVLPIQRMGLEGMERIEIIKGPTMLLTGAGPFGYSGGATNFVPKRANDPLTQVDAGISGRGQFALHADVARRFGPDDSTGLRVNAVYRDGPTATDDQSERFGLVTAALDWRGDGVRVSFDGGIQDYTIDRPTLGMTISPGIDVPTAPDAGANPFPSWTQAYAKDYYGVVRAEANLTPTVVAFGAVGARRGTSYVINAYTNIDDSAGNSTVYPSFEPYTATTQVSANAGVRGTLQTGSVSHRLAAMASAMRWHTGYTYTLDDYSFSSNIYNPSNGNVPDSFFQSSHYAPRAANYVDSGVSVADEIGMLDDTLLLLVGARYQSFQVDQFDVFSGAQVSSYDRSKTSPSFGVTFKLQPLLSLYANYMVGLSPAPVAPLYAANPGEMFAPIETKQVEAGVKWGWDRGFATMALFQIEQPSGYLDSNNVFVMAGEQRNRGVELNVTAEASPGVRVNASASWIDAVLTQTADGLQNGNTAPGVPRGGATLGGEWDLPMAERLTLLGRVIYSSNQYVDADNTQRIPSWTRLDLGVRWIFDVERHPVTLRLNVLNVLDSAYWASAFNGMLGLGTPRTVAFTASTTF